MSSKCYCILEINSWNKIEKKIEKKISKKFKIIALKVSNIVYMSNQEILSDVREEKKIYI